MAGSSIAIDEETRAYQDETAKIRFKQNLIQGLGGATVLGLATGLFGVLFRVATGGAVTAAATSGTAAAVSASTMALAWTGIGIAVIVGFGCLYVGSKLASQLVRIEQDHSAKQIANGINGKTIEVEQKPIPFPSQDKVEAIDAATTIKDAANDNAFNEAQPTVRNVELQDKVVPITAAQAERA